MKVKNKKLIIEKKLGIPANYQHKALHGNNFLQANWHHNKLEALRLLLDLKPDESVLNLGIGSGNFELEFANKVKTITGVDYNDEAIDFVKGQLKKLKITNVDLILSDIRNVHERIGSKKYDTILLIDVIEHLKIKDARKLIKNLRVMLKNQGRVCVVTPNYNSPWLILEMILDKVSIVPKFQGEQHLAKFNKNNLNEAFKSSGYNAVYNSTFNLFSYLSPFKSFSKMLLNFELRNLSRGGNLLVSIFQKT